MPAFTNSVTTVPGPPSFATSSTIVKLLFILVEPKYKPGTLLLPTASVPSILGSPSLAVLIFQGCHRRCSSCLLSIGSACHQHKSGEANCNQQNYKRLFCNKP